MFFVVFNSILKKVAKHSSRFNQITSFPPSFDPDDLLLLLHFWHAADEDCALVRLMNKVCVTERQTPHALQLLCRLSFRGLSIPGCKACNGRPLKNDRTRAGSDSDGGENRILHAIEVCGKCGDCNLQAPTWQWCAGRAAWQVEDR